MAHLYNFEEGETTEAGTLASWQTLLRRPYELDRGYYLLTSGTRLASGAVLAHMEFAGVALGKEGGAMLPDKLVVVPLVMREAKEDIAVIGHFDADPLLPFTGRGYFALAIMGEKDEPSVHARGLLDGMKDDFAAWGRPFVELHPSSSEALAQPAAHLASRPRGPGPRAQRGMQHDVRPPSRYCHRRLVRTCRLFLTRLQHVPLLEPASDYQGAVTSSTRCSVSIFTCPSSARR